MEFDSTKTILPPHRRCTYIILVTCFFDTPFVETFEHQNVAIRMYDMYILELLKNVAILFQTKGSEQVPNDSSSIVHVALT